MLMNWPDCAAAVCKRQNACEMRVKPISRRVGRCILDTCYYLRRKRKFTRLLTHLVFPLNARAVKLACALVIYRYVLSELCMYISHLPNFRVRTIRGERRNRGRGRERETASNWDHKRGSRVSSYATDR